MRPFLFRSVLACALALSYAAAQTSVVDHEVVTRLSELREDSQFPGITAGVAMPDGRVIYAAAGWSDADHKIALKATDRMLAGSTGKTFAGAVLLQAVDEGRLDLDSKIEKWIGNINGFESIPNAHDLTLRLLMSHRSGVPDYVVDKSFTSAFSTNLDKNWTALELVGQTFGKQPLFPAGSDFAYADANFVIAGLVFERATGLKLFEEVDRRILKKMIFAHTVTSESRIMTDLASGGMSARMGFGLDGPTIRDGKLVVNAQAEYAGGGIISNSGDLARWAKTLWEGRAFSPKLLTEVLDAKPTGTGRGGGKDAKYGLAVQVQPSDLGVTYAHAGWFPGYQTEMIYFPDRKFAVAVQVSSDPTRAKWSPHACAMEIAKVVAAALVKKAA